MKLDITKANVWRCLPKVSYVNFRKEFPNMGEQAFKTLFSFKRFWGGKIWTFGILHHQLSFSFVKCPLSDMAWPNASKQDRHMIKEANKYI